MTKAVENGFRHARSAALMSDFSRAPIGCVVTLRGRVLAAGFNSRKSHPQQQRYNRYRKFRGNPAPLPAQLHAEVAALVQLRNVDIDWAKVDIFIYRLRRDQPHGLARPCPACRRYLQDLGVKSIWYTTDEGMCHERLSTSAIEHKVI